MNVLSLFSGIGGIELGLESLGVFKTVGYVEIEAYAQAVLVKNMELGNAVVPQVAREVGKVILLLESEMNQNISSSEEI